MKRSSLLISITTLLLLFHSLFTHNLTHDIQVALYRIYIDEATKDLSIDITFELNDFNEVDYTNKAGFEKFIKSYLTKHTQFEFDAKAYPIEIMNLEYQDKHLKVHGRFAKEDSEIHQITILNSCLIESTNHSNIIEIRLADQERDFLMDSQRQQILIKL